MNTPSGGKTYIQTMIKIHGSHEAFRQHMREIASKGGRKGTTGGFYANRELARRAGEKGGRISRRPKRAKEEVEAPEPHKNFKAGFAAIFRR